jgi:hypothetical protein
MGAAVCGHAVEFVDEVIAGDAAFDHPAEAFSGVFVDDRGDLDRSPVGGDVELEVHRPHSVGRISGHVGRRGGGAVAFTLSTLRHPQSFLTPKALNLLVIHCPAFTSGVVVSRPEATAGMILGVGPQPLPQCGIRIGGCRRGGFVALGGAVLPGDAAGEPFTDPQYALKVTNGRPPAFRA